MFGVIFCWTPPHFWALAMKFKDDYAAVNVPMLPVVATRNRFATDCRLLLGDGRAVAAVAARDQLDLRRVRRRVRRLVPGVRHRLHNEVRRGQEGNPMKLFHLSNTYLMLVFVALPRTRWSASRSSACPSEFLPRVPRGRVRL